MSNNKPKKAEAEKIPDNRKIDYNKILEDVTILKISNKMQVTQIHGDQQENKKKT